MEKRYAIIELGSRGIRLLVADASPAGISKVVYSTGGMSELRRGIDEQGEIPGQIITQVRGQMEDYLLLAREKAAEVVYSFATEAVRTAANQAEVIAQLKPLCEFEVLDKNQEAQFSFLACVEAFKNTLLPGQSVLVVDQGGGSLELACGLLDAEGKIIIKGYQSLPLGTVELTRFFAEADTIRAGFESVRNYINQELERHKTFAAFGNMPPEYVFGLGSAITQLAQGLNKTDQPRKSLHDLHGFFIATKTIRDLLKATDAQLDVPKSALGDRIGVDGDMSTLMGGVLSYYNLLDKYHADGITVNRRGLRYGVLLGRCGYPFTVELPG